MSPFFVLPRVLTKPLRWSADSARRAQHNAYAANAALAVRRAEREAVDRFLTEYKRPGTAEVQAEDELVVPQPRPRR